MNPGLYQHLNGTVLKLRENKSWQYLSPLFGEWLDVFCPDTRELAKYPRNLEVHQDVIDAQVDFLNRKR